MQTLSLNILGPFGWPRFENGLPPVPAMPGVYLMTFGQRDGYLPYGVGITRRPLRQRFNAHARNLLAGEYNILELESVQKGVRKLVWEGWGWTPEKHASFAARNDEIAAAAKLQMIATQIFVVDTGTAPRIPERLEAAIANNFYAQEQILFDKGMLLMPCWDSEDPLLATLRSDSLLIGLPNELQI